MNISGSSIYSDLTAVESSKVFLLLNHGPTAFVSTRQDDRESIAQARWVMPIDSTSPKVAVMIDHTPLNQFSILPSGEFALSILPRADGPDQRRSGLCGCDTQAHSATLDTFEARHVQALLVRGCAAWLECRVLPQATAQRRHGVYLAEIIGAWAQAVRSHRSSTGDQGEAAVQAASPNRCYRAPKPAKAA